MEKNAFYTLLLMLLFTAALGQTTPLVPFDEIRQIADRNAQALWGDVYSAEPIAYYGFDDEIVAWQFNFSIGKEFPEKKILKELCISAKTNGDAYNQWGNGQYGRILMSTRTDMPVIIEHANMLSFEFAEAGRIKQLMQKINLNTDIQPTRGYYFGLFNIWYEYQVNGEKQYICPAPGKGVISEADFLARKTKTENTFKSSDYTNEWEKYKAGFIHPTDGDNYVPYYEYMPFIDWSYGCSPTAAMMLIAYYDYRSVVASSKFPLMVINTFDRWDGIQGEQDYYVCGTHSQLAYQMDTDTIYEGMTYIWNVDEGMEAVINGSLGYDFDIVNRYDLPWTYLKNEIDENRPVLNHSYNIEHTFCAVGYNNASNEIIVHNTWDYGLSWVDKTHADVLTKAQPGGSKGHHIRILEPVGDHRYNSDGLGEDYYADNWAEITWESDCPNSGTVLLAYSTNGGHGWDDICETENDHSYNWHIPAGINSTECRIIIYLKIDDEIAGADCSPQNFKIHADSPPPTMVSEHLYSTDSLSRYYHFQHTEPSWAVIGAKSDYYNCNWEIQHFNNTDFNQIPSFYSSNSQITNFMVVDGNHYPSTLRGIKIKPLNDQRPVQLEYEGGNENLVFGTNGPFVWNDDEIVEMKDIHLLPGKYYFELEVTSGWPNLGMALYGSSAGQYLRHRNDFIAFADFSSGSQTESFNVTITQEDDYGLCIFSNRHEAGIYTLKIVDAFIWTGEVSTDWHNPDNWSGHLVPDITSKVVISGDGHNTHITNADAACAQLNILHDGRLYIDNHNLTVNGNVTLNGWLLITNAASRMSYYGDFVVNQYGYLEIATNAGINAYGDWTFEENSNIQLNHGFVDFKGTSNSFVYTKSENSWFYDLKVSKTGGAFLAYDNFIGIEPLQIKNQFVLYDDAVFVQYAMYDVIFEGPFLSYAGSHFYFQNGTQRFERAGTGGISIFSESGSYFNNLVVSVDDWLGLSSNIEIRGDLLLEDGMFRTLGYDVYIKGNWYNNSGFDHDNSRVIFNGTGIQEITATNFWELELNKTGGELRVHESTVSVQHYDWTQGTVRVNGGWFQLNDLEDPGIHGTVILTSGRLDYRQDPGEYLDLNGNLQVSGGEMNIIGGNGDSYWPFSANASFTMSDGVLDFNTNGLRIHNTATYSLAESITGGIIRLNGNLTVARSDFNPTGGTVYFYGYAEDATVSVASGSNLFNLELDKSSKGAKAQVKTLTASGTLDLNGDFIITGGNFEAPTKMYVRGSFINTQTHWHFDELDGEVVLDGSVDQDFNQEETFYKLTINKPGDGTVTVANNVVFTVLNTLLVDRGNIIFQPGSSLMLNGNFDINYLGNIYFYGEAGNEVTVTSASKSRYGFDVSSGGFISANNTVFSNMDADGIYLHSGCYVDGENAFLECNFNSGAPGGTLITWDNGAEVVVHNAVFPANSTGCTYNVKKTTNNGHVFFDLATGPFSGADFESDPFARIDWEYVPPLNLPFTENWTSGSYTTNKWVPEGSNWTISGAWGNPTPCADFHFYPRMTNYTVPLRSHLIDGSETTDIHLKYDIRLANYSTATLEQLSVQVVQQNGDFITLAIYNNAGGSFGFNTAEFDISDFADGEIFYLRFTAMGSDTWSIDDWLIDNIQISGTPPEPGKLNGFILTDITELPIQGATIILNGTPWSGTSQVNGEYTITGITPGIYSATVSAPGYEPASVNGIQVFTGETTYKNFYLTFIPPTYCTENLYISGCVNGDGIDKFILGSINNAGSGCSPDGYGDFMEMSTDLSRGCPYEMVLSTNYPDQWISVWIDWNDDFLFSDTERIITDFIMALPSTDYTTTFIVPADASPGVHRLRARANWSGSSADPCDPYIYGETEDYTVNIIETTALINIVVTITDALSLVPVSGARVELYGTDWYSYTEDEGICILSYVTPGIYDVLVTAGNYQDLLLTGQMIWAGTNTSLELSLNPLAPLTHPINLKQGWQGLSSYLMPVDTDITDVFYPILPDLIIVQNLESTYWPGQQINTLQTWKQHSGYSIKLLNDITLPILGYPEQDKTCLIPQGWTIMPVVCSENVLVTDLFEANNKSADVIIVKEIAGTGVYWPSMAINTLEYLEPGNAYLVLMENEGLVTFPENSDKVTVTPDHEDFPAGFPWEIPTQTPASHLVAIPFSAGNRINTEKGSFIGAFTQDGICSGAALIEENTVITVFADDPFTIEKEGFSTNEKMFFRIFNPENQSHTQVEFAFDESSGLNGGLFVNLGVSVVSGIQQSSTGQFIPTDIQPEIYPNPTDGWVILRNIHENTSLFLLDINGREVYNERNVSHPFKINLEVFPKGIYLLHITSASKVYWLRIVKN